jgi:hypothetical protein
MGEENAEWPAEKFQLAPNDYLAAFGQVTLVYNMLENMIGHIFERSAPLDPDFAKSLFHKSNNRDRIDLLAEFVKTNEDDEESRDAILYCISCYDICTENRNVLMHSTYFDIGDSVRLVKKNKSYKEIHFDVSLINLRRVADDIASVFVYAVGVFGTVSRRKWAKSSSPPIKIPEQALPAKPPKPHRLVPTGA